MNNKNLSYLKNFRKTVASLQRRRPFEQAMRSFPGGDFDYIGLVERELLIDLGLRPGDYLIDVGCGSGRLAKPLSEYLTGKYLGIDIVPQLVHYARQLVRRHDWRFEVAAGLAIPEADHEADMICFFSVFTHLYHEHSYLYLEEARRVLKPGGKIVFSFLDFTVEEHWPIFENTARNAYKNALPNVFVGRDAITAWAAHLDLKIEMIEDAAKPFINLRQPIAQPGDGTTQGPVPFGQSLCVLTTKAAQPAI